MESSGECRGCQRNIKFAVKQARLCRTCYNKTYLTSQKRREYYKNKKKRRETTSSVEPAIDVHQHRHGKSIKKEDFQGNRSPPRTLPDNQGQVPHLSLAFWPPFLGPSSSFFLSAGRKAVLLSLFSLHSSDRLCFL
jgi:hypothetical protein